LGNQPWVRKTKRRGDDDDVQPTTIVAALADKEVTDGGARGCQYYSLGGFLPNDLIMITPKWSEIAHLVLLRSLGVTFVGFAATDAAFATLPDQIGTTTVDGYFCRHEPAAPRVCGMEPPGSASLPRVPSGFGDVGRLVKRAALLVLVGPTAAPDEFGTAAEYVALPALGTTATAQAEGHRGADDTTATRHFRGAPEGSRGRHAGDAEQSAHLGAFGHPPGLGNQPRGTSSRP